MDRRVMAVRIKLLPNFQSATFQIWILFTKGVGQGLREEGHYITIVSR